MVVITRIAMWSNREIVWTYNSYDGEGLVVDNIYGMRSTEEGGKEGEDEIVVGRMEGGALLFGEEIFQYTLFVGQFGKEMQTLHLARQATMFRIVSRFSLERRWR